MVLKVATKGACAMLRDRDVNCTVTGKRGKSIDVKQRREKSAIPTIAIQLFFFRMINYVIVVYAR